MRFTFWLYTAIYVVFTVVHLYGSYTKRDGLRNATKGIILLAVLGMYLEWAASAGEKPLVSLVLALTTSWLGDMLLIPHGVKWFTAGGISFWISHGLFIAAYIKSGINFAAVNPVIAVLISIAYFLIATYIFIKLKRCLPDKLFYPMYGYLLTNAGMNVFAWLRLMGGACTVWSGLITAIGATLFFVSDCTLFFVRFDKESAVKTHFLVMLTYSLGELMIVAGLALLSV